MLTLPAGSKMNQFKSEHPATTYKEFKAEILNEIARCLNMPYNVAAANSANYNYASGRLDWQVYFRSIRTVRGWIEQHFTNRVFWVWLREAALIPGYFTKPIPMSSVKTLPAMSRPALDVQWFWPGAEHVDPQKEAKAQQLRLQGLTTNLAIEYAVQGRDWEVEVRQLAKEKELLDELGLKKEFAPPKELEKEDDEGQTTEDGGQESEGNEDEQ